MAQEAAGTQAVAEEATVALLVVFGVAGALALCGCAGFLALLVLLTVEKRKKRSDEERTSIASADGIAMKTGRVVRVKAAARAQERDSIDTNEGSRHLSNGRALPAGWRRHFDDTEELSYFTDAAGTRPATWTQPEADEFELIKLDFDDVQTDWARVRRGSVQTAWSASDATSAAGGQESFECARDAETGRLFFVERSSGRCSWSPPPRLEFRVDGDGFAYAKRDFVARYGGVDEFNRAAVFTAASAGGAALARGRPPSSVLGGIAEAAEGDDEEEEEEESCVSDPGRASLATFVSPMQARQATLGRDTESSAFEPRIIEHL